MKSAFAAVFVPAILFSVPLQAARQDDVHNTMHSNTSRLGSRPAIVVDMQPELVKKEFRQSCSRCCFFEDRTYSEGSVIKSENVLLECVTDTKSIGTDNLVWQRIKP